MFFVLLGLFNAYRLNSSMWWLSSKKKEIDSLPHPSPNFLLLFPVLEEQKTLQAAIDLLSLLKYPESQYRVIFITTEREEKKSDTPTTAEVLEDILPKNQSFSYMHYPKKTGFKADQLNWAIKQLERGDQVDSETIIGVYDIDSVINPSILEYAAHVFSLTRTNVAQQPSSYFKNWDRLPFMGKSFAIFQTVYGCFYEVPMWRNWNRAFSPMRYCTGHGLFVKHTFLKRINYFPSPLEDTRFGHICSFLKEPIEVIPIFDDCETTPSLFQRIKQASVWFSGDVQYLSALPVARRIKSISRTFAYWLILSKTWRTIVWMFLGYVTTFGIILGIVFREPWLVAALFFYYLLPTLVLTLHANTLRSLGSSISLNKIALPLFVLPLTSLLKSLGPWYAIARFFKSKISKHEFTYPKTSRT